ncbi:hypothetical protein [Pseudomonas sp.]|uniref:hypothetical protein n=1 Tax=Pseudomonas sp. TaxID=306 RepID=UPI003D6E49B2
MAEEKTGAAKHSKDYRDRKNAEAERLGIETVKVDVPLGTRGGLDIARKTHGYTQLQEMLQDLQLSFLAASPEEQARRLKRPDAPAFKISPKLARQFETTSMAELKRDSGDHVIAPIVTAS